MQGQILSAITEKTIRLFESRKIIREDRYSQPAQEDAPSNFRQD